MNIKHLISLAPSIAILIAGCSSATLTSAPRTSMPASTQHAEQASSIPTRVVAPTSALRATAAPAATTAPAAKAAPIAIAAELNPPDAGRIPLEPTAASSSPNGVTVERAPTATPIAESTFKDYGVNPFVETSRDHLSTFGLDVDTASYVIAKGYLNQGMLPAMESVRAEEYINAFNQDYPKPANVAFGIYADGAPSPFQSDNSYLLRFGIQGYDVPDRERKPSALTFVIDVSGSMADAGKLDMVKDALRVLVERLRSTDQVAIAAFTTNAWVVLNPTAGSDQRTILNAIDTLKPMNSTNVDAGLRVGYELANRMFSGALQNRVILCSDGVANTGTTDTSTLVDMVRGYGERGVMLTTVGVGMGTYNDVLLEQLADKGNGFYAYINSIDEAHKLFLERLTGTLQTIARDAKVQVDFNTDVVARYRLIGYENRAIADQDFRNNNVDAGEVGAGHSATALYAVELKPNAEGRIATVQLRWQDPNTRQVKEINGNYNTSDLARSYEEASPRFQMAAAVAQFAEILRQSPYVGNGGFGQLQRYADQVGQLLPQDAEVQQFVELVSRANTIGR